MRRFVLSSFVTNLYFFIKFYFSHYHLKVSLKIYLIRMAISNIIVYYFKKKKMSRINTMCN